jgi:hypothetical protein
LPHGVTVSARVDGAGLPAVGDDVTITVRGVVLPFPASPHRSEGTALAGTILDDAPPAEPVSLA